MSRIGICKLCGKSTKLTFEHVPPRSAFNNHPVKIVNGFETLAEGRLPWDTSGLKGKIQQKGKGDYYLCAECNNNTGAWYVPYYQDFVNEVYKAIQSIDISKLGGVEITTRKIRPLAILKQILVMFCDINHDCFGNEQLREFLMDKENNRYDLNGYKVFMYISRADVEKYMGVCAIGDIVTGQTKLITEIASYPVGVKMYLNVTKDFNEIGVDITDFCKFDYNTEVEMIIQFPILESNIMFPEDYRRKEEIVPGYKTI